MKGTIMSLVEKNLTQKNIELTENHPEFINRREKEQKLYATVPKYLRELFLDQARPIEQVYLSSPDDEFSLRVRKYERDDGTEYSAALKDRGSRLYGTLDRFEVSTPISQEAFEHFANNPDLPRVQKLRAEPLEGVVVDFIDEANLQLVEVEHPDLKERVYLSQYMAELAKGHLVDMSYDRQLDSEYIAHSLSKAERTPSPETLDAFSDRVVGEMVAQYALGKKQVVVGLTGMSGSGKTTATKAIQQKVTELFGESFTPLILSTDDYHFGKKHLEETYGAPWTEWDDPRTYNTKELAHDLALIAEGHSLIRRHFDFASEEVVFDEEVAPSPFVVVEGLYAGSQDLTAVRDLHFELPTSIATAVGRDIRRLVIENRANHVFPTPESRLSTNLKPHCHFT